MCIAGYSPLHLCALNGRVEEMKSLIMKGAEVNLKVRERQTEPKSCVKTAYELVKSSSHYLHLYPFYWYLTFYKCRNKCLKATWDRYSEDVHKMIAKFQETRTCIVLNPVIIFSAVTKLQASWLPTSFIL